VGWRGRSSAGSPRSRCASTTGPWQVSTLGPDAGIDYWRQWYLVWDAAPGRHSLSVRATDMTGELQPEGRTTPFPEGARGWHTIVVTID
jgi:hypothetical protein